MWSRRGREVAVPAPPANAVTLAKFIGNMYFRVCARQSAHLHLVKRPFASRHGAFFIAVVVFLTITFAAGGHFTNLPFASLQGAAWTDTGTAAIANAAAMEMKIERMGAPLLLEKLPQPLGSRREDMEVREKSPVIRL